MSVNIKIDTIQLDNHLFWRNRQTYTRDSVDVRYTVFGIPVIYQHRRRSEIGGNIITLTSDDDYGWQLISTARAIKNYSNRIEVGEYFDFQYYTQTWECTFYGQSSGEPAVDWSPVIRSATSDSDWCLLTINLIITQLKIGEGQVL